MATYLLKWNPRLWRWRNLAADVEKLRRGRALQRRWSCGNRKRMSLGDRVFLLRTGSEPRGIMASGAIIRTPYEDRHWDPARRALVETALFVKVRFDVVLDPSREDLLTLEHLQSGHLADFHWSTRPSGVIIPPAVAREVEKAWAGFLASQRRLAARLRPNRPAARRSSPEQLLPAAFEEALRAVRPQITERQWCMLQAHFLAPDHTTTALELALAAGFRRHSAANLLYGRLGSLLRQASDALGALTGQKSHALATFLAPDEATAHWRLRMHTPLSEALTRLGWFADDIDDVSLSETWRRAAAEGDLRQRLVWHRNRERSLRWAKLRQARALHPEGRLVCQVPGCGFDFEAVYGALGEGFAEVHHLLPLSELVPGRLTRLADLEVVCANCHRMIHRRGECRPIAGLIRGRSASG